MKIIAYEKLFCNRGKKEKPRRHNEKVRKKQGESKKKIKAKVRKKQGKSKRMESPSARPHGFFSLLFPAALRFPFFASRSLLLPCSVPFIPFRGTPFPSSFLYPLLPFMSFPFSIVPLPFITFLPSFFVFVFCLSFFIFFVIFRPRPSPPMVLNSPHSYIFLPCFMKRIHTEDLIFKENR